MRSTHTFTRKLAALISLALQLMLAGAVPFVDGSLDVAVAQSRAHVEAEGDPCAPLHDHLTCAFCRILGRELLGAARVESAPAAAPAVSLAGFIPVAVSLPSEHHATPESRAPPVV